MEVRRCCCKRLFVILTVLLSVFVINSSAQPVMAYTIKNGRMYIQLPKPIREAALDSFIVQFDLADLDLKNFLQSNKTDSLKHLGWAIDINNEVGLVISKAFVPFKSRGNPEEKYFFQNSPNPLFPAVNNGLLYGVNTFRNKHPFSVRDSLIRFFFRGQQSARTVMLAGSFNNWAPDQLAMQKTDSGWIFDVKAGPGKYWYKFIVDGRWLVDRDNLVSENDGRGNINSVFFRPNFVFSLPGFTAAKRVAVAGSFNGWKRDGLPMQRTATGWELPLYLSEGTHVYKFVVDGKWYLDPSNPETVPDGTGGLNAVIRRGNAHIFKLNGYTGATEVLLMGSFNQWRDFEWKMKKTATGWELPYYLGPGNYAYKFKIDGTLIADPDNPLTSSASGNSYLVLHANQLFRLKGFSTAKAVYLAGDFNSWDPYAFAMKKEGDSWVFPVHLTVGKHVYKYIVDGKWIIDPDNKFWEQNEYGTGNSVLWIEK